MIIEVARSLAKDVALGKGAEYTMGIQLGNTMGSCQADTDAGVHVVQNVHTSGLISCDTSANVCRDLIATI